MEFGCYIFGKNDDWEAICTDLDIAVQADSFDATKDLLDEAVNGYLHEVQKLPECEQKEFLRRRTPLLLRTKFRVNYYFHGVRNRFSGVSSTVQWYSTNCPTA